MARSHNSPFCFELVDHLDASDAAFVSTEEKMKRNESHCLVPFFFSSAGRQPKLIVFTVCTVTKVTKRNDTKTVVAAARKFAESPLNVQNLRRPAFVGFAPFRQISGMEIGKFAALNFEMAIIDQMRSGRFIVLSDEWHTNCALIVD